MNAPAASAHSANPDNPEAIPQSRSTARAPFGDCTRWTFVDQLRAGGPDATSALQELSRFLYAPVLGAIRRLVRDDELAEELAQAFFADVLLWRQLIERADRTQGRLRTLVRHAARNFVRDHWRRERVRAELERAVPLDEATSQSDDRTVEPADASFETDWLDSLCGEACRRCEAYFRSRGMAGHWTLFARARLHPALRQLSRPANLTEIMNDHGFASANQARGALDVVMKRLRVQLIEVAGMASLSDEDHHEQVAKLESMGVRVS